MRPTPVASGSRPIAEVAPGRDGSLPFQPAARRTTAVSATRAGCAQRRACRRGTFYQERDSRVSRRAVPAGATVGLDARATVDLRGARFVRLSARRLSPRRAVAVTGFRAMPSSDLNYVVDVLAAVAAVEPQSVLVIGPGFGKYGVLLREMLDLRSWHIRRIRAVRAPDRRHRSGAEVPDPDSPIRIR